MDLATGCYEYASGKFPNNLELMMGLFNCYVREYSFVKQQQVGFLVSYLNFLVSKLLHFFSMGYRTPIATCGFIFFRRQPSKCTSSLVKKGFCSGLFVVSSYRFLRPSFLNSSFNILLTIPNTT